MRMNSGYGPRLAGTAALAAFLLCAGPAPAWQALTGRATAEADGAGLADVEIRAQIVAPAAVLATLDKPQPYLVGRSDADGNFRIDLPRETGRIAWDRVEAVVLGFAREGLRTHAEHLTRPQVGRPVVVRLDRVAAAPAIDDARRRRLEALRVAGAPAVFILPFALRGPTPAAGEDLAEQLRLALARMLRRHLSGFALATPLPEIAVRTVDLKSLEIDDAVAPEALLDALDALAVIGGRLEAGAVRGRTIVVSEFSMRPGAPRLPATYRVEDGVPAENAPALAELERQLLPRWTRLAVLALAASELRAAAAANDAQRLRGVQQFVAQELRRSGRGSADLVPQAQALQQDAEAALRRLGQR